MQISTGQARSSRRVRSALLALALLVVSTPADAQPALEALRLLRPPAPRARASRPPDDKEQPATSTTLRGTRLVLGGACQFSTGTGSPEGVLTGNVCDVYQQTNGAAGTTFWRKETGAGNTGWESSVAKSSANTWTGVQTFSTPIALPSGGTNAALTPVNGGLAYSTASAIALSAAGSSGQIARSGGAGAPTWSTATFPSTATTTAAYLRADGTNWITSTLVLPNAATAGRLVFASSTNTFGEDADLAFSTGTNTLVVTGGYFERNRGAMQGDWTSVSFNAADFTASSGTWTVDAGDVAAFRYTLIGNTIVVNYDIRSTDVSAVASLRIKIPGGCTANANLTSFDVVIDNGGASVMGLVLTTVSGTNILIFSSIGGANFAITAADNTTVQGTVTFEVTGC